MKNKNDFDLSEYLKANKNYPRTIFVEATPYCNIKCVMCPCYLEGQEVYKYRKSKAMSFEVFKKIIDFIKSEFNFQIAFTYSGEPLMNKEIFKMISYLSDNSIPSSMHSNALLITQNKFKDIVECGLDRLKISIDGTDEKTYSQLRRGGDFRVLLKNISGLMEYKKGKNAVSPEVQLQYIVTKTNYQNIDKFMKLADDLKVDKAYLKTLAINYLKDDGTADQKYRDFIRDEFFIEGDVARYLKDEEGNIKLKDKGICPELQNTVITCDGDVVCCCFDVFGKYTFGNASQKSLKDIWDSKKYDNFRKESMDKRKLPVCDMCNASGHIKKDIYNN